MLFFFINNLFIQLNTIMDTTSFSHGQTQSKLWLCEKLEPLLPDNAVVAVLGCWYNVLGFMLLTRCKSKYQHILGIDISPEAIAGADKICQGFMIGDDARLRNDCADAGTVNLQGQQVVINCSAEHMTDDWFGNVDPSTLVCIQTSNVNEPEAPWLVTNPVTTLDDFAKRFPMSRTMLLEKIHFDYGSFSYDRYMLIGRK